MPRRSTHVLVPFALVLACGGNHAGAEREPSASAPAASATGRAAGDRDQRFSAPDARGWGEAAGLRYLERTLGGGRADEPMPMLIMVHGLGDAPRRDWFPGADAIDTPLRMIMPQAPTPYGHGGYAWFPYRVRDNDPDELARGIAAAEERLARAVAVLRARRPTVGRPIVAGFSQGGMLSYALALRHPELVSFSLPISGLLPEPLWPANRRAGTRYPRIAAMHGDADDLVPIDNARRLTTHLRELGFDVELREFPGVPHTITEAMTAHSVALLNAQVRVLVQR